MVKQFASETKLTVDETVMQELNTSISSLLIENQAAMESMLQKNLSTEISKGFEEFAKLMVESDNEEQLSCIQCGEVIFFNSRDIKNPRTQLGPAISMSVHGALAGSLIAVGPTLHANTRSIAQFTTMTIHILNSLKESMQS